MKDKSKDKTNQLLKCYVNTQDFHKIISDYEVSGYTSMSAYLRKRLTTTGTVIHRPQEMMAALDKIGIELGHTGNNINQMPKKVHILDKKDTTYIHTIRHFNELFIQYNQQMKALSNAYRAILRKF